MYIICCTEFTNKLVLTFTIKLVRSINTKTLVNITLGVFRHGTRNFKEYFIHGKSTQAPPSCTKYNSSPINGQCTNHRILLYNGPLLCGLMCP